jgi:hypothetical protein
MKKEKLQILNLIKQLHFLRLTPLFVATTVFTVFFTSSKVSAQNTPVAPPLPTSIFRIGERLTYNISFEKFNNAGYAEIYVVSRGKLADRDAVELRSKIKTNDFVSAAFYFLDESRTTFASSEKGLPLYIRKTENASVLPKETVNNFLVVPTINYDFLTLIYQARNAGGIGNFIFQENDKIYNVSMLSAGIERVKTDAGDFDTNFVTVQSEYLTEKGWTDFKINFSSDEQKIPVLFRFKTAKGDFKIALASAQIIEGETAETTQQPIQIQTPRPAPTPKPIPTPTPYVENQPLLKELPFQLGETLDYQISDGSRTVGKIRLEAKERKLFSNQDSLFLTATVTSSLTGNRIFTVGDSIKANVNPDSIAPQQIEIKFTGDLSALNQTARFDQITGVASLNGVTRVDIPVGTHNILSLIYAMRSFNLKPSKDAANPVNDTKVAVFWGKESYVFTLRPANADIIILGGEKISAQQVSIRTGIPQLDSLSLRVWLSNDDKRVPLRFAIGSFQADLITENVIQP